MNSRRLNCLPPRFGIVAAHTSRLEVVRSRVGNVRLGSKADIARDQLNVRFTPKSRHWLSVSRCPLCAKSGHSIATCLYKAECVIPARRRWHLRQITDEIEPSERGRHVLGARRNSERETRKPRCAKRSAPKRSRQRMKPILHWKKNKAEALFAVQADELRSAIHISNHHR